MYNVLRNLCQEEGLDLDRLIQDKEFYYRSFRIPKGNGKFRCIDAPYGDLIKAQKICVKYLSTKPELVHPLAKAFKKGVSLWYNALPHVGHKNLLKIDLKDFFGTITEAMVAAKLGWDIAALVTYRGYVPQGAPTSPIISNIIAYSLDCKMHAWAKKNSLAYTRYADDMSFSGSAIPEDYRTHLNSIVISEGFIINSKKTRLQRPHRQQSVTGITVNDKVSISKRKCRHNLRAVLYFYGKNKLPLTDEIKGMLSYIKSISESQYQKLVGDYEKQLNHKS